MSSTDAIVRLALLGRARFESNARSAGRSLGFVERGATRANAALGRMSIGAGVAAGVAGLGALGVAAGAVGVHFNMLKDSQQVAFETFLGSADKARVLMGQLQDLSTASPVLDLASTGDAARLLLNYGMSAKTILPTIKALGDASAASGRSVGEVLPLAARALGQIQSKGKLQMEELNQLAETVGISQVELRKQLGLTSDEWITAFTPGNSIKASVAIPAILETIRKKAAGAADKLAKTTAGRVANAKELMTQAAGEFTRPLWDALGSALGASGGFLKQLPRRAREFTAGVTGRRPIDPKTGKAATGAMSRTEKAGARVRAVAGDALAFLQDKVVPGVRDVVGQVLDAFKPAMPFVTNILLPLLGGIAKGVLGGVVTAFKVLVPIIKIVATVLGTLGKWARPLRGVFAGIGLVIGFIAGGPILKLLGGMSKIGIVFRLAAVPIRIVARVFGVVARMLGVAGRAFSTGLLTVQRFVGTFRGAVARIATFALNIVRTFLNLPHRIAGAMRGKLGALGAFFFRVGKSIVDAIVKAIKAAPSAIIDAVSSIVPGPLKGALGKVLGLGKSLFGGGGSKPKVSEDDPRWDPATMGNRRGHQPGIVAQRRVVPGSVAVSPIIQVKPSILVQQNKRGQWNAVASVDRAIAESS